MPTVFDDYDSSLFQIGARMVQHVFEALNHESGPRIPQPKQDDADDSATARGHDFPEVQVECQHDPLFAGCLLKDLAIRQALQPLVSQMVSIVSLYA